MQNFHKHDLESLVLTLRHIFRWHLDSTSSDDMEEHERDFRKAKPFLDPVFVALYEDAHWEDVLKHPPRRIEVALLPMIGEDRKRFPNASEKALTLFVSLPKGCIRRGFRRHLWGAHMPNRFHFDEGEEMEDFFVLIGTHSPIADL